MILEKNKVVFENANIPHFYGELNPSNFAPYPKNPNIAKVFREIGFADELGSGVKNLYKYSKEKILDLLSTNSKLTREDLSKQIGVSANAIKQHLVKLQEEEKLQRIGCRKEGYWEITDAK